MLAILSHVSNAVYFYAQKGKWRCFSDTVVKNNVSNFDPMSDTYLTLKSSH